ncbi:hypothetical protein BO99DRAFT_408556 [Aspergillus violaceofuscus CBS 115571]|uniref:Uncharacterized protein n=1 Tax=Aspergillus violaceofuscus (strain CBS 115571) TaxID=1450538 RepID=A0A2V5IKX1_ASPV1|nr:hypothetical protein BO99DRAFT_408556 [Aspergillus violaceofuscus CBS 115571]
MYTSNQQVTSSVFQPESQVDQGGLVFDVSNYNAVHAHAKRISGCWLGHLQTTVGEEDSAGGRGAEMLRGGTKKSRFLPSTPNCYSVYKEWPRPSRAVPPIEDLVHDTAPSSPPAYSVSTVSCISVAMGLSCRSVFEEGREGQPPQRSSRALLLTAERPNLGLQKAKARGTPKQNEHTQNSERQNYNGLQSHLQLKFVERDREVTSWCASHEKKPESISPSLANAVDDGGNGVRVRDIRR